MSVLVTGGAGYIGSHTCVTLLERGYKVVVIDNLSNGSEEALRRVRRISDSRLEFVRGDVRDENAVARILDENRVDEVIHFAALKSVSESIEKPLTYFDNNVVGTISLLKAMSKVGVRNLVFSSSATVYGIPEAVPVREDAPLRALNPYGRTKLVMEELIRDQCAADVDFGAVLLRYFNPAGAHTSGLIGEDPLSIPNNLMPCLSRVAIGSRDRIEIFGNDYPTCDGTGVRDYIHVMDLAEAHAKALEFLRSHSGCHAFNLGFGAGLSVMQLVAAFEQASGVPINRAIVGRRAGDVAEIWADPSLAKKMLNWEAKRGLDLICEDTWRWQLQNPLGYAGSMESEPE